MPAPGPIADGLETARRFVIGIPTAARLTGFQRSRRLVVDILSPLDAGPDRIRQHLRESLHLIRGVGGVDEAGPPNDCLESGHGHLRRDAILRLMPIPRYNWHANSVLAPCPGCDGAITNFDTKGHSNTNLGVVIIDGPHQYEGKTYSRILWQFVRCANC